jgi:hypothetical protein
LNPNGDLILNSGLGVEWVGVVLREHEISRNFGSIYFFDIIYYPNSMRCLFVPEFVDGLG